MVLSVSRFFVHEENTHSRRLVERGDALKARMASSASQDPSGSSRPLVFTRSAIVAKLREDAACDAILLRIVDMILEPISKPYYGDANLLDSSCLGLSSGVVQSLRRARESPCERSSVMLSV